MSYTARDFPDSATPPLTPLPDLAFGPVTPGNAQNGSFAYGFATGGGLDVGLTPNIFVSGEFEYIYFRRSTAFTSPWQLAASVRA